MSFKFVSGGGNVVEPTVINMPVSGVVAPGQIAVYTPAGTGGAMADAVVALTTTGSTVIGVFQDYKQGASDTLAKVIKINSDQIWEVDCANTVTTAQIGIRQGLSASRGILHNAVTNLETTEKMFMVTGISGSTSGSGKVLGYFINNVGPAALNAA